jgi:hypothetical protein
MTVQYLPPPQSMPSDRAAAMRAQLELFVAADQEPIKRRRQRRRRYLGGFGALAVIAASGGTALAIALLHSKPVTDYSVARCYSVAVFKPGTTFPGTTMATTGPVTDAVEACSAMWEAGVIQPGVERALPRPARSAYPVPALVGCVLPGGAAAVFPGPADTCQRLKLAPEDPPATQAAQPLASP